MKDRNAGWTRTGGRTVFECHWFQVEQDDIELPGGERIQFHTVAHPGWAMVLPFLEDGRVVMERTYRWPKRDWVLECPRGGLDGEPPEEAARRELEEETGYVADSLTHLGSFYATGGHSDELFHVYVSRDTRPGGQICRESTEAIEVELFEIERLKEMALRGEISDAPTALAILMVCARPELVPRQKIPRPQPLSE